MGRSAMEPAVNAIEHALDLFKCLDPTFAVRSAEKVRTWPAAWSFSRLTFSRAVMARASPAVCNYVVRVLPTFPNSVWRFFRPPRMRDRMHGLGCGQRQKGRRQSMAFDSGLDAGRIGGDRDMSIGFDAALGYCQTDAR
jgi:hypothetical protein